MTQNQKIIDALITDAVISFTVPIDILERIIRVVEETE